jgi:hypothetical protein
MDLVTARRTGRSPTSSRPPARSGPGWWRVSDPGDRTELEADRVAAQVMGMPAAPVVQRKAEGGGPCPSAPTGPEPVDDAERTKDQPVVAAKREPGAGPAVTAAVRALPTGDSGAPLPPSVRAFFEPRFGHSFAQVRVHTDTRAGATARSAAAAAFTIGDHIWFADGRYAPDSTDGRRLLAHELTHVVQQHGGTPQPAASPALPQIGHAAGGVVRRFGLRGFPPAEEARMKVAVPAAMAKVRSCTARSAWTRFMLPRIIDSLRYDYVPDLGLCGWTFPSSWYVEIGKSAFSPSTCCALESTIAHEAYHTDWHTESGAQELECDCFSCSC